MHGEELQPNEPLLIAAMNAEARVAAVAAHAWSMVTLPKPGRRKKGDTPKEWAQRILARAESEMRKNDIIVDLMMPEVFKAVVKHALAKSAGSGKVAA